MSLATASLLVVAAVGMLLSAPAAGASYRFWTYWQGQGTEWAFASVGPAYALPADGSVDGWSFAVTAEQGGQEAAPGDAPDFAAICADVAPEAGRKRVALVVDPGDASIAPSGETPIAPVRTCVVADDDATGYDILRSVLTVRTQDGLVCGLGGYPADECAPILDAGAMTALAVDSDDGAPKPGVESSAPVEQSAPESGTPLATIAVIVGLAAAALLVFALRRRRERTSSDA